ncbi:hypothetical protein AB5J72_10200 [Streptomyces sp. CG1]|uniref:hypothetical protein n=1 Tax=Streptomyces sp. CG1 TaxID=1287523 RepID=UPI0034E21273
MGGRDLRRWEPPYWVVQRLCASIAESWDSWDGQLALQGIDPRSWTLKRMLNAAEAAMDAAAEDDAERARNRTRLYAPPRGAAREARRRPIPGVSMSRDQALCPAAQLAADDAKLTGGRSG